MCTTTKSDHQGLDTAPHPAKKATFRRGLSRNQEREMAALIAGGDQATRNRVVQANLGLVVTIAREFLGRGLPLDDLVGEGNLGLIRAAEEFDPEFGTRFGTYASYWVKEAIWDALINRTATIRLPAHMVRLLTKWRRTERTLCCERDHMPDFEEVASILGLSEVQKSLVRDARRAGQLALEGGADGEKAIRLQDEVTDRHAPVDSILEADDEWSSLKRKMERLNDRERTILALHHGLDGDRLSLRQVGSRLGLSGEAVRKIELGAIHKLGRDHDDRLAVSRSGGLTGRDCRVGGDRNGDHRRATAAPASRRGPAHVRVELNGRQAGRSGESSMRVHDRFPTRRSVGEESAMEIHGSQSLT
jgi:RNA polymerase primary sigma factor